MKKYTFLMILMAFGMQIGIQGMDRNVTNTLSMTEKQAEELNTLEERLSVGVALLKEKMKSFGSKENIEEVEFSISRIERFNAIKDKLKFVDSPIEKAGLYLDAIHFYEKLLNIRDGYQLYAQILNAYKKEESWAQYVYLQLYERVLFNLPTKEKESNYLVCGLLALPTSLFNNLIEDAKKYKYRERLEKLDEYRRKEKFCAAEDIEMNKRLDEFLEAFKRQTYEPADKGDSKTNIDSKSKDDKKSDNAK